jgi:hypothetical protein
MNGKTFDVPDDPKEAAEIAAVIKDISDNMTKIEAMQSYIKEAKKSLKEEYEIPVDAIGLMIKLYHKQARTEYFEKQDDLETLYDTLFPNEGEAYE